MPKAIVHRVGSWVDGWSDRMAKLAALALLGGLGYGISQAGCENAAISYAHALYPGASCTAVNTTLGMADKDSAVCRVEGRVLQCRSFECVEAR